jgi:hypothetical protein
MPLPDYPESLGNDFLANAPKNPDVPDVSFYSPFKELVLLGIFSPEKITPFLKIPLLEIFGKNGGD